MARPRIDPSRTTISKEGWELHVVRTEVQVHRGKKRTYGSYEVFLHGERQRGLSGHMCECPGPSDNEHRGSGKRIRAGTYPLYTQDGRYRTVDYSVEEKAGATPMPAVLLRGTGSRTGILIHPAHPPKLYLSSIGCFNPTAVVDATQNMDFFDSRRRVVALIESLKAFHPGVFVERAIRRIPGASVIIDGEPN